MSNARNTNNHGHGSNSRHKKKTQNTRGYHPYAAGIPPQYPRLPDSLTEESKTIAPKAWAMERQVPEEREYVIVPRASRGGRLRGEAPQAYGPENQFLGAITQNGQNFDRMSADERNLHQLVDGKMSERQIHRECATRGNADPLDRYLAFDDDIGNLYSSVCRKPDRATIDPDLLNKLDALGLSDPSGPSHPEGAQRPTQGVPYHEPDKTGFLHDHRWQRRKQYYP